MTTPSGQLGPRLFVGREREMHDLLSGLEDACASRGRLLLLVGEPGIGKTRTADELALQARQRNALVLVGRCHEGEGAPPYWPWIQLLRAHARASEPEDLLSDMGHGAADIAQAIDELRVWLPDLPSQPDLEAEQARFRFFDSLTTFLKNAARRQPLVLILDDLHRADHPSLLLLQFLVREIATAAVLVVGTYRDVEVSRRHPFLEALGELAREAVSRVVELKGLSEADVARFMEVVGGSAPPHALVATVHERTGGNPFFVSELVRLLAPDGDWTRASQVASAAIPLGVREVIAARLDRLSPACRHLLQIAAVAGREFDTRVVAAAAPARRDDSMADTGLDPVLIPLEEAVQQRMITEVSGAVWTYSFSHALIRDALYAELTRNQRVRLHRCIGESLESLAAAAPEKRLAALAYHFFAGSAGGEDDGKAVAYARRAAEHAQAALAFEEAARGYELALNALMRRGSDERQQSELLLALGQAHHQAGDEPASRDAYRRGGDLARRRGEGELLARAALGLAGIVIGVEVDPEVVAVLEEALAALPRQDGGLRAMLLARLALELYLSPDTERAAAISAEAVATARRAGDDRALIYTLEARLLTVWDRTGPLDRLAISDEMIRLAAQITSPEHLMRGHHLSIPALLELGRIEDVDAVIGTAARLVEELPQPSHRYRWGLNMCRAMRAMIDGRFAEAERLAATALAFGQRVQPQSAASFFAAQLFFLRREQGRLSELEDALRGAVAAYPSFRAWHSGLAILYAESGRIVEAQRELERVAHDDFRAIAEGISAMAGLSLLAEVCALVADRARASVLYERLLPHADRVVVAAFGLACSGAMAHPLGLLAATMGNWENALRHFEHALAVNRRLGAPPFVARTQLEYAAALLAASDAGARDQAESRRAACDLLSEAYATASALGMEGLAAKAKGLMESLGAAAPPVSRRAGESTSQLPRVPAGIAETSGSDATATRRAGAQGSQQESAISPTDNFIRREARHWIVAFEGQSCRLKDAKGLRYLAVLLRLPNRPIHVTELVRAAASDDAPLRAADDARDRVRELLAELEEAERHHDLGTAARVQAEIDELAAELSERMGVGPGAHRAGAEPQLLRLRITKAIKAAVRKIGAQHPALGHHLQTTIRTGRFCSYVPDPTKPIRWS